MHRYLLVLALLFQVNSFSQIDPAKLDSLSRSIDSSAKAYRQWQDSFQKRQDSIYESALRSQDTERNMRNLTNWTLENEERKRKQKQQAYIRIGIGVLFLIVLIVGWARRRKKHKNK
mgnify:CR=1 FL=1